QWFSFIYVTDLVDAIFSGLMSTQQNEVYNLSDGHAYNRFELAQYVKKALHKRTIKFFIPLPVVEVIATSLEIVSKRKTPVLNKEKLNELTARNWKCSIEKAKKELSFS